ncbi:MAG: hypothetical protein LBD32_00320 [Cytophagales bacterium]|jgi:hypothetical protein|nr:hypothetical protein [Cytophagales bacterium]
MLESIADLDKSIDSVISAKKNKLVSSIFPLVTGIKNDIQIIHKFRKDKLDMVEFLKSKLRALEADPGYCPTGLTAGVAAYC